MRITCPNCNAQYDVSDDMIPSEGRDVQCSNCGTTWFQEGRPRSANAVDERAVRRPGRKAPPPPETAEEAADEDEDDDVGPAPAARAGATPRRPEPDQETLDILRAERAREEKLRDGFAAADAKRNRSVEEDVADATPEPEPAADPRAQAAAERSRMAAAASLARARDRGGRTGRAEPAVDDDPDVSDVIAATLRDAATPATEDDDDDDLHPASAAAPVSARAARRELLPDIEEINSSLRPDERAAEAEAQANAEAEAPVIAKRSSGFRIGFLLVCAVILIFVGLYVFADQIAEMVPQVAGVLAKYVAWVDTQRVALAAAAEALTESIARDN